MTRSLHKGDELVIASHNAGKVEELEALLAPLELRIVSAGELTFGSAEETGDTFTENALIKARHTCEATGLPALSDDSGISVLALDGAPGVHTARWGGPDRDFDRAMARVEEALRELDDPNHRAEYVCALAICWPDGNEEAFEARRRGLWVWPPRAPGVGFEPVFLPDGYALTYSEMSPLLRSRVNARAEAMRRLLSAVAPH